MKTVILMILALLPLFAQRTNSTMSAPGTKVDFTTAANTKPLKMGASNPGSCEQGELFVNTASSTGQMLKLCETANNFVTPEPRWQIEP